MRVGPIRIRSIRLLGFSGARFAGRSGLSVRLRREHPMTPPVSVQKLRNPARLESILSP